MSKTRDLVRGGAGLAGEAYDRLRVDRRPRARTDGRRLVAYLVHQFLPAHVGGTEVLTAGLARGVRELGFGSEVVTASVRPMRGLARRLASRSNKGVDVHEVRIDARRGLSAHTEYDSPSLQAPVMRLLALRRPDLVHVMHPMYLTIAALRAARLAGLPVVVTLTDYWSICPRHTLLRSDGTVCSGPDSPRACVPCTRATFGYPRDGDHASSAALARRNAVIRDELLQARRIIVLSAVQRDLLAGSGVPAGRLELIPHGLDTTGLAVREPGLRPVRRFAFVGGISAAKGPAVVLEALARRPDLDIELQVWGRVGDDPYSRLVAGLARRDRRVSLRGTFEPARFGRVLAGVDAMLVPSTTHDNEPLVAKAAIFTRTPLLASRIGSLQAMVRDGGDGRLVAPADPEAWAAAMHEARARGLSGGASRGGITTLDENVAAMAAIYREVLQSPPPAAA